MRDKDLNLFTLAGAFSDEDKVRRLIESRIWPNGSVCSHCGHKKAYPMHSKEGAKKPMTPGSYKCAACRKRFTGRTGTVFGESPLPLRKWIVAMHLMTGNKKGISSHQLARELKVTIQTAWFLSHRIREAMAEKHNNLLCGTVEVDETYVCGKPRKGTGPHNRGRGTTKAPVMVLVERDGKTRTQRVDRVNAKELKGVIRAHVHEDSKIVTDEFLSYRRIGNSFAGGQSVVNHSAEQLVNEEGEHTNTAESFFALLKRGHCGIFHSLSKQHQFRYCNEFSFLWNLRKVSDGERMVAAIRGPEGKRLVYRPSGIAGNQKKG
jgi:transposase-like protein